MSEPVDTENERTTIEPAAPWPHMEADHARRELAALDLLTRGYSRYRVKTITGLSMPHIVRLADVVREEATSPVNPRNVCKRPYRPMERVRSLVPPAPPPPEPEQLTFSLD
ncbi:hypothetical protein ACWGJT_20320 [Streptomyces xantholiticus]